MESSLAEVDSELPGRSTAPTRKAPDPDAPAERPHSGARERLAEHGPRPLGDDDLLALVIGSGSGGVSARALARELLVGASLHELARFDVLEWRERRGIGWAGAARMAAVFEIGRRVATPAAARRQVVRRPGDLGPGLMARYGFERSECFGILLLDGRNRLVREVLLSRGGWSASVVRPREVFRCALLSAAPALVLFHNHPSGDPTPSREDVAITRQVREAGDLLGVRVLDHLVVGSEGFVSLKERGLL